MHHKVSFFIVLVVILLSGPGCKETLSVLNVTISGDGDMNNGGYYVTLRVYQLNNERKFLDAKFDEFWKDDEAELAGEIIGVIKQYEVDPNQVIPIELTLNKETEYVGFAADLNDVEDDGWKQIYDADILLERKSVLRIGKNKLLLQLL